MRSHALATSAGFAVAARSARISSNGASLSTPTRLARSCTLARCSADTAPRPAAAARAGSARSSRPRASHADAPAGESRPNADSHTRAVRNPSVSASVPHIETVGQPGHIGRELVERGQRRQQFRTDRLVGQPDHVHLGQAGQVRLHVLHQRRSPVSRTHVPDATNHRRGYTTTFIKILRSVYCGRPPTPAPSSAECAST